MEFLFRHRGEGKRQVKPSQDVALLEDQIAAESSDDSDYVVEGKRRSNSNSGNSSEGGSSDSDDTSSSDGDEGDAEDSEAGIAAEAASLLKNEGLTTQELLELSKRQLSLSSGLVSTEDVKVCGCCLGASSSDANEIVDCDGCGISVHEGCYGITESGSVASTVSSASTEPWFCEPCRAGFGSPPGCELCPVVGGVYKETDVGRWVHLACALYVPGVAFGDPSNMRHVTVFEMNYSVWGRKVCTLCSSGEDCGGLTGGVRLARTGVCIQCDAGMCKSFFHVSCAHAAGLLSEPSYEQQQQQPQGHVEDTYLAHCRLHSDRQAVRKRRRAFLVHHLASRRKREAIRGRKPLAAAATLSSRSVPGETSDERILRKLNRKRSSYRLDKAHSHDPWLPTQKLPRLLTTSASAIRKIQRLGALQGVDVERQQRQEVQMQALAEAKKKWHVSPAFSVEFVAYYEDRERRIVDLSDLVADELALNRRLTSEDAEARSAHTRCAEAHEEGLRENLSLRSAIHSYRTLLAQLGAAVPPEDSVPALRPLQKAIVEIVTPNLKARATVYSQQSRLSAAASISTNYCGICKKPHDQHLLARCDTCKLHYHLSCLTPPLTRMPKKSKLYGWSCSECYPNSTSEEEAAAHEDEGASDATKRQNRRRRLAASKALIESARHSSDFDTEWPAWAIPDVGGAAVETSPGRKKRGRPRKNVPPPDVGVLEAAAEDPAAERESLQPMPPVPAPPKDELYSNGQESARQLLIDKAAAKAERKEAKRTEKERRKQEKRRRKKLLKEAQKRDPLPTAGSEADIVEDESGLCTVSIKPKPIKLKINLAAGGSGSSLPRSAGGSNGYLSSEETPPGKRARRDSIGSGKGSASKKDLRTVCDKCSLEGTNSNLVRCDECKRCFHFACLVPPIKKSPKVAGYSWSCSECAPSDVDLDWHLD